MKNREARRARRRLRRVAHKLGLSVEVLKASPIWMQEGRDATEEEYTNWARSQHKDACQEYRAAWPIVQQRGKCVDYLKLGRPCNAQYAHSCMCWSGQFEATADRVHFTWGDIAKNYRARLAGIQRRS